MTRAHSQSRSGLSPDDHAELDRICDKFAVAWGNDASPRIEDYLAQVGDRLRTALLEELIAQEVDLRREAGGMVHVQEYLDRFPDDQEAVRWGFSLVPERQAEPFEVSTQSLAKGVDTNLGQPVANEGDVPTKIARYHVKRRLGAGQFGAVYLAHDPLIDRWVAIKMPHADRIGSEMDVARYVEEARNAAKLDHPGIVRIHDVQHKGESLFVVQQYVQGRTLESQMKCDIFVPLQVAKMLVKIADALSHAHEHGIVHRDLKPANILLDRYGDPYVADFGLAIELSSRPPLVRELAGSPAYMSPEQTRGALHQLDHRSDIWSLGVIMYELLVHVRPFRGECRRELFELIQQGTPKAPRLIRPEIPLGLQAICLKCLKKKRVDRYRSADELRTALQTYLDTVEPSSDSAALFGLTRYLNTTPYDNDTASEVLRHIIALFPQGDCLVLALRDSRGSLIPRNCMGRTRECISTAIHHEICDEATKMKHAVIGHALGTALGREEAEAQGLQVMCAPLADRDGTPIGILQIVSDKTEKPFTQSQLQLLTHVAYQVSSAINMEEIRNRLRLQNTVEEDLRPAEPVTPPVVYRPSEDGYEFYDYYSTEHGNIAHPMLWLHYIQSGDGKITALVASASRNSPEGSTLNLWQTLGSLLSCLESGVPPSNALLQANNLLCEMGGYSIATAVIAALDPETHQVTLANAGGWSPLMRRCGGDLEGIDNKVAGLPLGISEDASYSELKFRLKKGEVLALFASEISDDVDEIDFDMLRESSTMRSSLSLEPRQFGKLIIEACERQPGVRRTGRIELVCFGRT